VDGRTTILEIDKGGWGIYRTGEGGGTGVLLYARYLAEGRELGDSGGLPAFWSLWSLMASTAVRAAHDHCLETRTSIPLKEHWIEIHENIACSEIHSPTSPPDLQRKDCGKDPHQQQHEVALLAHFSPSNESR
jgi:hypothetical protein